MKWVLRLVLVLVVLAAAGGVGGYFYLDTLVRRGIAGGAAYATGVPTELAEADLAPFAGELTLAGLQVANPPGFKSRHFLELRHAELALSLGSLMQDRVVVPRLHLRGIDLNLEKQGDSANYQIILANLEKLSGPPQEQPQPGKQYVIQEIVVSDVTVKAALMPAVGEPRLLTVRVPEIRLEDVGSDSDGGVLLSQVNGIVVQAILQAVAEQAGDLLPAAIASGLEGGVAGLGNLGGFAIESVGGGTAQLINDLTGTEAVGNALEGLTRGAGGLLGQGGEVLGKGAGGVVQGTGDALNKGVEGTGQAVKDLGSGLGKLLGGDKPVAEQPTAEGEK